MFRMVTHQLKLASRIVKSVGVIANTVAEVLDPRLSSYLEEGQTLDGIGTIQITVVRWIEDDHQELEKLEAAHRDAQQKLKQLMLRRDKEQELVYSQALQIRTTFEDAFGQGTAPIYLGLDPGLGEVEPLVLRRYVRGAVNVLSNPGFTTPEPAVAGLWEDPQRYAEQILASLEPFEATLDEIGTQQREVEVAVRARTDLLGELKGRLKWSVRLFEALYHLAGQGYHAERLLPKSSRSTGADEAEPPDGGDSEETAAETPETAEAALPESPVTAQESSEASS